MHATTEQLLSIRDRQPVDAAVAAHVNGCPECGAALRGLNRLRDRLRALPAERPPAELWSTIAAGAAAVPARQRRWPLFVGTAAGFALGIALVLNMARTPDPGPVPGTTTDLIAATPAPASSVNGVSTADLLAASRLLEAQLHALPAAPRMARASTVLTLQALEDQIFEVDALLGEPGLSQADERALWQQRVRLMDALMQVRLAQLAEHH